MSDGACEKKPKWRKAYGIALGALVAVLVAGAFGWAWLSGPLQQIEPREEGEAPNLAKALTMWQDPDQGGAAARNRGKPNELERDAG